MNQSDAVAFLVEHQTQILSGIAIVGGFLVRHLWPRAEAKVDDVFMNPANPRVRSLALAMDTWIEESVPDSGSGRYTAAAALIVHEEPVLAPFQPALVTILTNLGVVARREAIKAQEQVTPAAAPAASPAAASAPVPPQA